MDKLASLVAIYNHEGIHLWWRFITNLRGYKSHIEHTDASLSHNNFTFYIEKDLFLTQLGENLFIPYITWQWYINSDDNTIKTYVCNY